MTSDAPEAITAEQDKPKEETIYTYEWTPKEGRALIRRIQAFLKKQREYKRRWRAKRRAQGLKP